MDLFVSIHARSLSPAMLAMCLHLRERKSEANDSDSGVYGVPSMCNPVSIWHQLRPDVCTVPLEQYICILPGF